MGQNCNLISACWDKISIESAPGGTKFQFDKAPGPSVKRADMKPGDMVYYEATYFDIRKKKTGAGTSHTSRSARSACTGPGTWIFDDASVCYDQCVYGHRS